MYQISSYVNTLLKSYRTLAKHPCARLEGRVLAAHASSINSISIGGNIVLRIRFGIASDSQRRFGSDLNQYALSSKFTHFRFSIRTLIRFHQCDSDFVNLEQHLEQLLPITVFQQLIVNGYWTIEGCV